MTDTADNLDPRTEQYAKFTPERRETFLNVLRQGWTITRAARSAGLSREYVYRLRDKLPDFAAEWDEAWKEGTETIEDAGISRATAGVVREKGVYYKGDKVATEIETEYSDTLMMFFLKGRKPDTYRDNASIKHSGDANSPLTADLTVTLVDDRPASPASDSINRGSDDGHNGQ